jgi:hypothetical protein
MHTHHTVEVSDRFTDVLREYTHELLVAILADELPVEPDLFWFALAEGTLLEDARRELVTIVQDAGHEYNRRLAEHLYDCPVMEVE